MRQKLIRICILLTLITVSLDTHASFETKIDGVTYYLNEIYGTDTGTATAVSYDGSSTDLTLPESISGNYGGKNYTFVLTTIGERAFFNNSDLKSITFPETILEIGEYAFYGCTGLKVLTLPASITEIGDDAFSNCSGLHMVVLNHSVNAPIIGRDTFSGVKALLDLRSFSETPSFWDNSGIWGDGYFYKVCDEGSCGENISWCYGESGNEFYFREGYLRMTGIGDMPDYDWDDQPWHEHWSELRTLVIEEGITTIGNYAFEGTNISYATLPETITSIGVRSFYCCSFFYICTPSSVPYDYAQALIIPESVTSIGDGAFEYCYNLESATFPASVTTIGDRLFSRCERLAEITVEEGNAIYDSRDNCNGIIETNNNKLIAGCQGTIIPNTVTTIDEYAFYECINLSSITIPASVTTIVGNPFKGSLISGEESILSTIIVDENNPVYDSRNNCNAIIETNSNSLIVGCNGTIVPEGVTSIGPGAFFGCKGLTTLTLPISLTSIWGNAFMYCTNLESLSIPKNVSSIGNSAFSQSNNLRFIDLSDCKQLPSITVSRSTPTNVFYNVSESTTIYLPGGKGHSDGGEKNVVIGRTCTGAVILATKPFSSPVEYDADNIIFNRSFTSDVTCTVCLPFSIAVSNVSGGTFYEFDGISDDYVVTMNEVTGNLIANTPYLFVPSAVSMNFGGSVTVSIVNDETTTSSEKGNWTFCGTYDKISWVTDADFNGATIYGFAANSYGDNVSPGDFVKVVASTDSYINPFRAYLKYTESSSGTRSIQEEMPNKLTVKLLSARNGEATDLGVTRLNSSAKERVLFDLSGRKIPSYQILPNGVYIESGKKVVIK